MNNIPRIIHQTWRNEQLPDELLIYQETWKKNHPEWQYRLWTDSDNIAFITQYYPWFLPIYTAYPKNIMRVDAVRYFILHHFGGVYADLDFECLKPVDALLQGRQLIFGLEPYSHTQIQAAVKRNLKNVVCNAWMASIPYHPFWKQLLWVLTTNSHRKFTLDATGPYMLTRAISSYDSPEQITLIKPEFLYPIDMLQKEKGIWNDPQFRQTAMEKAFAVHHWHASWWKGGTTVPDLF